jgi:hypothetical protein
MRSRLVATALAAAVAFAACGGSSRVSAKD